MPTTSLKIFVFCIWIEYLHKIRIWEMFYKKLSIVLCKESKKFPYCTSLSLYFPLNGVVKFKYFLESIFISFFIVMNEPLVFLSQVLMKLRFKQKIKGLCLCGWVFSLIALPMALIILKEIKDDEMLMKVYKTSVHWNLNWPLYSITTL